MDSEVKAHVSKRPRKDKSSSSSSDSTVAASPKSLLDLAERGDCATLLRMLADERVDLQNDPPRRENGDTALHVAASGGHLKVVVALLGAGAQVDDLGHRRRTPLHCAVEHGHLAVAQRLLDAGAKIDIKNEDGATAVEMAARSNKELLELFVRKGTSVDASDGNGDPLLVLAAKAKRWEVVEYLLEKGASPTVCKRASECALAFASEGDQANVVRHLPRSGVASNAEQVEEALQRAKSATMVAAFVNAVPDQVQGDPGRNDLVGIAAKGRLEAVVALLEAGVSVNPKGTFNYTALHYASENGHVACVRELLKRGADANAKTDNGTTPLHAACDAGQEECVLELLEGGADMTAREANRWTPLHSACCWGRTECVRVLLEQGADVDVKDLYGFTPLHGAAGGDHVECVRLLLAAGANPAEKNNEEQTPLDLSLTDETRSLFSDL